MSITKKKVPLVNLASPRKWDGESLFKECKEQGIYPAFENGNFVGYLDRHTGKQVTTTLPALSSIAYDAYVKAGKDAASKALAKEEKTDKPGKIEKPPKDPSKARADNSQEIHLIAKENPRRAGCPGWKSFNLYKDGMTIAEYLTHEGARLDHLRWDVKNGFITLK